jgi:hypothetical protein
MPQYWITIDLRPTAFSFNPSFMNSEMPTPIIPKGFGVKIIIPDPIDPDSECDTSQVRKCKDACGKVGKVFVTCEVQFEWQPDGTAVRTVTSTCMDPNDPHVAGSVINTTQIRFAD